MAASTFRPQRAIRLLGGSMLALLLFSPGAGAQTYVWTGTTAPFQWPIASNWMFNLPPLSNGMGTVSFGTTSGSTAPDAPTPYSIKRLEFHDAQAYGIVGSTLTIGDGGISGSCSANCSLSNAIALAANQDWTNSGLGGITCNGAVALSGRSLAIRAGSGSSPGPFTMNGAITGSGNLFKDGPGVLTLAGANSYSGVTVIHGGTLRSGANNVLPTGTLTLRSGTLDLNGFTEVIGPGAVTDTGLVMGAWPTDGSAAGSIATLLSPVNPLKISASGTFIYYDSTGSPGTAELSGLLDLATTSGTRTIEVGDSPAAVVDLKISANVSNPGGNVGSNAVLSKIGPGRLELSGTNSFERDVVVQEGTIRVSNSLGLGASGGPQAYVISGASLELRPGVSVPVLLSIAGDGVGGSGALHALSGGTSTWLGLILLSGPVSIGADPGAILVCQQVFGAGSLSVRGGGTLLLPSSNNYGPQTDVETGATLRVRNPTGSATGLSTVVVHSGAKLEGDGVIAGPLVVQPGGTVEPGVTGPGTLDGASASFAATSKLRIQATSALVGGCGRLACTGAVDLNGVLQFLPTFTPAPGESFVVLTCASRTGIFSGTSLPVLPDGSWIVQYSPTSVTLRVVGTVDAPAPASHLTRLEPAAPNPFAGTTTIAYALAKPGRVDLVLFDAGGRRISTLVDGIDTPAGRHETRWSGRDETGRACSPGVYWVRLRVDGVAERPRTVTLTK